MSIADAQRACDAHQKACVPGPCRRRRRLERTNRLDSPSLRTRCGGHGSRCRIERFFSPYSIERFFSPYSIERFFSPYSIKRFFSPYSIKRFFSPYIRSCTPGAAVSPDATTLTAALHAPKKRTHARTHAHTTSARTHTHHGMTAADGLLLPGGPQRRGLRLVLPAPGKASIRREECAADSGHGPARREPGPV